MNKDLNKIEESFENIPEEIKSYIYGYDFRDKLKNFVKGISLTDEQEKDFKNSIYNYVAQIESEQDFVSKINLLSPSLEVNQKIIKWVQENLVNPILELATLKFYEEEPVEETKDNLNQLETIKNSLTSSTVVAPTKRDYSIEKNEDSNVTKTPDYKIDPYREIPEK